MLLHTLLHTLSEESQGSSTIVPTTPLASAAPALVILAAVVVVLASYAIRLLVIGPYHDDEMDHRGLGGLTSRGVRHIFAWFMRPFWKGLAAAAVPPNAVTMLSFGLGLMTGIAAAAGHFVLAGWLFIGGGLLDFLDGRLARETGKATQGGAALDSVVDRYSEAALLVGLSWYFRDTWVLGVSLLALTGSLLVPYVRARGEALGVTMKDVGVMQRPERVLLLGLGVALAPVLQAVLDPNERKPSFHLAAAAIAILAVLSHLTAAQRLLYLVRALGSQGAHTRPKGIASRVAVIGALAVLFDYSTMHALVSDVLLPLPAATGLAYVVGAILAVAAAWSSHGKIRFKMKRAVFVAITSALLNIGGVAAAEVLVAGIDYRLAWFVVRAVVLSVWTLPLIGEFRLQPTPEALLGAPRAALREASLARAPRFDP